MASALRALARGFRVPARAYHRRRDAMTSLLTLTEENVKGAGSERVIYRLGRRDQGLIGPLVNVRVSGNEMVPPHVAANSAAKRQTVSEHRGFYELVDDTEVASIIDMTAAHFRLQRQQNAEKASLLHDPLVAPPSQVLEKNPAAGNARYTFVFVDAGSQFKGHERRVLIREKDGTLRTPAPAEQEKFNQMFFPATHEKRELPPMFEPAMLSNMMSFNMHTDILDEICRVRQPYQPDYIRVHKEVYENIDSRRIYNLLQGTPHWTRFVDYLVSKNQIEGLTMALVDEARMTDAEALVSEFVASNPTARVSGTARKLGITEPAQLVRILLQNVESKKKAAMPFGERKFPAAGDASKLAAGGKTRSPLAPAQQGKGKPRKVALAADAAGEPVLPAAEAAVQSPKKTFVKKPVGMKKTAGDAQTSTAEASATAAAPEAASKPTPQ